jgi:hypothetical protein
MKNTKIDFEWLDHFDGPVVSKGPLTEEELQMMRAITAADQQKEPNAAKKAPIAKKS